MKICRRCLEEKDDANFYKHKSYCKSCWIVICNERRRIKGRTETPEQNRKWNLKSKFGLSMAEYDEMLKAQNGVCAICAAPETAKSTSTERDKKRLSVDHNHTTGKVRGLLCSMCNSAIGKLKDDPEIIRRAANYIERTREAS